MKDTTHADVVDSSELDAVYDSAMASIRMEKRKREAAGYAVMAGMMAYSEPMMDGDSKLGKAVHVAKLFLIGFAFLAPVLLLAGHVLG